MKYLLAPLTALFIVIGCQIIGTHIESVRMTLIAAALYSIIMLGLAAWLMARSGEKPARPVHPYIHAARK